MTDLVQMAVGTVNAQLVNPSKAVKALAHKTLSYVVEGAEFSGAGNGQWNGRSSFFSNLKGTFPAGFAHLLHAELVRAGHRVHLVKKPLPEPLGPEDPQVDAFGNDNPDYDYQMRTIRQLLRHGRGICQVATGGGKCLGRDTPILMFDGSIKPVQDVIVGDLLMGPDSQSRRVLSTCSGRDPLYRVTPTKGAPTS